ncbi:hypothetical protein [Desulfobacter latus]|uniref:Uncharacterized protein n=1 Tax=Desulfobacter latus TaxID=2292 RepID=A0A850TDG4_9BACT|nr:hypothetical protein [Desulfobacter latus]NWH06327.1 hypothetical protein [Desulfobacter latus]
MHGKLGNKAFSVLSVVKSNFKTTSVMVRTRINDRPCESYHPTMCNAPPLFVRDDNAFAYLMAFIDVPFMNMVGM